MNFVRLGRCILKNAFQFIVLLMCMILIMAVFDWLQLSVLWLIPIGIVVFAVHDYFTEIPSETEQTTT